MKNANYSNNIVTKPWGYEYLVFENHNVALWLLYIKKNHVTSFHCHSKKSTGLIVLEGDCEISFISESKILSSLEKIMIRKGFFHSTKSISENGSFVLEIETPNDKTDLVRFKDSYGRENLPYEDESHYIPLNSECLKISNEIDNALVYKNILFNIYNIQDINFFNQLEDNQMLMFLNGGILSDNDLIVSGAGDITKAFSVKELIKVFKQVAKDTSLILFERL